MKKFQLLRLEGWKEGNLKVQYEDSSIKYLEGKATLFHNEVDQINKFLAKGKYVIETLIRGSESSNHYTLKVKIKFTNDRSESKKNSHRQEISI